MQKKNAQWLIGAALVALGLTYLMYAALQGATVYYVTVEEFLAQQTTLSGAGLRIAGIVADGSIRRDPATADLRFVIRGTSPRAVLAVRYNGVTTDLFRDGANVVLEGTYQPAAQVFQAVTLMTACPSKYESQLKQPQ